jgi:hypothetical protein
VDGVGWVWMTLSKLGKRSQLGFLGLGFPPGLVGVCVLLLKSGIIIDTMNIYPFKSSIFIYPASLHGWGTRYYHMHHTSINK